MKTKKLLFKFGRSLWLLLLIPFMLLGAGLRAQNLDLPSSAAGNLVLRLDADVIDREHNDTIGIWHDRSGLGNNFTQVFGSRRPLLIENGLNNLNVVRFDGEDDVLDIPWESSLDMEKITMFAVYKSTPRSSYPNLDIDVITEKAMGTSKRSWWLAVNNNFSRGGTEEGIDPGAIWFRTSSGGDLANNLYHNGNGTYSYNDGNAYMVAVVVPEAVDGAQSNMYINGQGSVSSFEASTIDYSNDQKIRIGAGTKSDGSLERFFDGDLAELIIYNRALSDEERIEIEDELKLKWFNIPKVNQWPIASDIIFGDEISESLLSEGDATVVGDFEFVNPTDIPDAAGPYDAEVVFIPRGENGDGVPYQPVYKKIIVTVNPKPLIVTADDDGKTYGAQDPAFSVSYDGFVSGQDENDLNGQLSFTRENGKNVGQYAIIPSGLSSENYDISFVNGTLSINPLEIAVSADFITKEYGFEDPSLTYAYEPSLIGDDAFGGELSREAGEDLGAYEISQGNLSLTDNYVLHFTAGGFQITQRTITVAADNIAIYFGNEEPTLTYTFSPNLMGDDSFTGELTREEGSAPGLYSIQQGTLELNNRYILEFIDAIFTIHGDLIAHFDASSIENVADGEKVPTWFDKSTYNNHGVQNDFERQPKLILNGINNLPVLRFDGNNDFLKIDDPSSSDVENITVFAVYKNKSPENHTFKNDFGVITAFEKGAANRSWWLTLSYNYTGQGASPGALWFRTSKGSGYANDLIANGNYHNGQAYMVTVVVDSPDGSSELFIDGDSKAVSSSSAIEYQSGRIFRIGAGTNNSGGVERYFDGDLAEIMIYNRALSDEERQLVEQRLQAKWFGPQIPEITEWPTASDITYGQALSASILDGGVASVEGEFSFVNDTYIPDAAGPYTAAVVFTPDDTDQWEIVEGTVEITVNKAEATILVNGYEGTYDGQPYGATLVSADGVNDEDLAEFVTVGAETFTNVPGGEVDWSFEHNNYEPQSGTVDISITKAEATIVVNGYEGVYDGQAYGATLVSADGVNDEDLAESVTVGTETFTDVPGGEVDWSFEHNNYESQSGTVDISITKAEATIAVNGYSGVYDGQPYGATLVSADGVNDEDLSLSVILGTETFTDVPGGSVDWSFENDNYVSQNGTVDIIITKAEAIIAVQGVTVTYDGQEHGATGTATGVEGEALAGLDLGLTFTNVPGGTANWTFTDVTGNYNDDAGSVEIVIEKADATIVVNGATVTYDGAEHGATGTATGVEGEALAGLDLGLTFINVPGGTANWTFTDVTGNYNNASGSVEIVINEKLLTITAHNQSRQYSDPNPYWTATSSGFVYGEDESVLDGTLIFTGAGPGSDNNTAPGGYAITPGGLTSNNYTIQFVDGLLTVTEEDADITYIGTRLMAVKAGGIANLDLRVVVDDDVDGYPGNIINGNITFQITWEGGSKTLSTAISIADLVNDQKAVVNVPFDVTLANDETSRTLNIQLMAGGYYIGEEQVVAVVYVPAGDHITGGGFIVPDIDESAGEYPSAGGSHANFGFNFRYHPRTGVLQGEANLVIRNEEGTFQFKSTEALAMGITTASEHPRAQFTVRGELRQGNNVLLSNLTMHATVEDQGNPGHNDEIGFTIWNGNQLIYSSNWNGSNTARLNLSGGNIVIHRGGTDVDIVDLKNEDLTSILEGETATDLAQQVELSVFPNPFREKLFIRFTPADDTHAVLELYDMKGALVQTLFDGEVLGHESYEVEFIPRSRNTAILFYRLRLGTEVSNGKIIHQQ